MAHRFPEQERARLRDERRHRIQPAEEIMARMALRPGETVIDLGSGTGYLAVPMAHRTARVLALDAQRKMLETMCSTDPNVVNIFPVLAEIPPLPLTNASFDRAVFINVLHEINEKDLLVRELERTLKEGGRVSIVDFPRRETSSGPPVSERIGPEAVVELFKGFHVVGRWDLNEYYQLELEKDWAHRQ